MPPPIITESISIKIIKPAEEKIKGPILDIKVEVKGFRTTEHGFPGPRVGVPSPRDIVTFPIKNIKISVDDIKEAELENETGEFETSFVMTSPGKKVIIIDASFTGVEGRKISRRLKQEIDILQWIPPVSGIASITELSSETGEIRISGYTEISDIAVSKVSYKLNDGIFREFDNLTHSFILPPLVPPELRPFPRPTSEPRPEPIPIWQWSAEVDGADIYDEEMNISGENTVVIKSEDRLGNIAEISKKFIFGPPETTVTLPPNTTENNRFDQIMWGGEENKATIKITGITTDPTSNIKAINWRFKKGENEIEDALKPIEISVSKKVEWEFYALIPTPENHTIEIVAQDVADNKEITLVYIGVRN